MPDRLRDGLRGAELLHGPQPGTPIDGPFSLPGRGRGRVRAAPALAYGRLPDGSTPRSSSRRPHGARAQDPLRGEDAWFAFLPDAAVRGFRAGKRRVALRLPPASRQCGYSASRSF